MARNDHRARVTHVRRLRPYPRSRILLRGACANVTSAPEQKFMHVGTHKPVESCIQHFTPSSFGQLPFISYEVVELPLFEVGDARNGKQSNVIGEFIHLISLFIESVKKRKHS